MYLFFAINFDNLGVISVGLRRRGLSIAGSAVAPTPTKEHVVASGVVGLLRIFYLPARSRNIRPSRPLTASLRRHSWPTVYPGPAEARGLPLRGLLLVNFLGISFRRMCTLILNLLCR